MKTAILVMFFVSGVALGGMVVVVADKVFPVRSASHGAPGFSSFLQN